MSGRLYYIPISVDTVSTARDLLEVAAASNKPLEILSCTITFSGVDNQQLEITAKRCSGAFTSGSGGASPTPVKGNSDDATAGFTAETGNSTRVTGGTSETVIDEFVPSQGGWSYLPTPEQTIQINAGEAFVVGLESAPSPALSIRGWATVKEM